MKAAELVAARRSGRAPRAFLLWLTDRDLPSLGTPETGTLKLSEDFALQDWRPFVDLRVSVIGPRDAKAKVLQACERLREAKAELVVGFATDGETTLQNQVFGAEEFPWPT